jgi:transcriptional regulator with XRE-family HTH domain
MDFMTHEQLKAGRLKVGLTQVEAAVRLGVSQPYLSQLEKGERPITAELARSAATLYRLTATTLPIPKSTAPRVPTNSDALARQLAGLGYPGFAHLRHAKANPAAILLEALVQEDLEVRLAEALPWVVLTYPDMDWPWLIREVKLRNAQNRLGFVVAMALELATTQARFRPALERISSAAQELERARLVREDTLCRGSMPRAERDWLAQTRSALARHWNLVTGLTADQLSYVSR